jgi:hypothetical protein
VIRTKNQIQVFIMKRYRLPAMGFAATCVVTSCLMMIGCQTTKGDKRTLRERLPLIGKKKDEKPEPYPNPVKMVTTWTPDTLIQSGRTPTRGFGGRVYFYDEKSKAVPVEGTLVVHGFDDTAEEGKQTARRFEFTPEQFTEHFSQSDLGASYSIWIPWDAVGGAQRKISLVPSFRTTEGKLVQDIAATVSLPGFTAEDHDEALVKKFAPQYQEYRDAVASGVSSDKMTTTTIARRSPSRQSESSDNPAIESGETKIADIEAVPKKSSPSDTKSKWDGRMMPAAYKRNSK